MRKWLFLANKVFTQFPLISRKLASVIFKCNVWDFWKAIIFKRAINNDFSFVAINEVWCERQKMTNYKLQLQEARVIQVRVQSHHS